MVYKLINIITDIINNISFILCILLITLILSNNINIYFYLFLFIIFYYFIKKMFYLFYV